MFAQLLGFSFGSGPKFKFWPLRVGHLRASVPRPDRRALKERLIQGLCLIQTGGREDYGMRGKPVAAEAVMMLQQPEVRRVFSWGSCP